MTTPRVATHSPGRHAPFGRRRRDQHFARGRAAHAHIFVRFADAAAATGGEIAPDAVACEVLGRRRILGCDLGPVAVQFFGDELRKAGQRPLAHLGARDTDHHRVVGLDHDPCVDFRRRVSTSSQCRLDEGHVEAERHATGSGGYADDEVAAGDGDYRVHNRPPQPRCAASPPLAASLMAARTRL